MVYILCVRTSCKYLRYEHRVGKRSAQLAFFFFLHKKDFICRSGTLVKQAKPSVVIWLLWLFLLLLLLLLCCGWSRTCSRCCRSWGSRDSHSPTSRHTGQLVNILGNDSSVFFLFSSRMTLLSWSLSASMPMLFRIFLISLALREELPLRATNK